MLVKSLILVFISYYVLIGSESHQQINELNVKCRNENGLQEDEVTYLNETRNIETNDEKVKCFIKCILMGLKLINDEGELTLEDASEKKIKFRRHFSTCKNVTGTNSCDKAVNFQNCVWKEIDANEKSPE